MAPSPEFLDQYAALSQKVGDADLSDRTRLAVAGRDRVAFLHSFCTGDIKRLDVGRGCEAFITNPQGKTLGHALVFCEPDRLLLDTSPGHAELLTAHFDKYLISEDVQVVDLTSQRALLLVAGPLAPELLSRLAGVPAPKELLAFSTASIAGCQVAVYRVEYAGPASFFVQSADADLAAVKAAILCAGGRQCGLESVESCRLEAGFPLFGRDIDSDNLPQEVGRDKQAISFTKGCYLGQETVARIDALGHVNRGLVGLRFPGSELPPAGTLLQADGKDAGHITSSAWSPLLNAPLAMGYVRRMQAKPGTQLESPLGSASVIALPVSRD
jgi:folate-binding protein YgfZ